MLGVLISVTLNAQNMNRYITLTVQQGQNIKLGLTADADNTPVKIVSGNQVYNITVDAGLGSDDYYTAGASTMTIYGNIKEFSCHFNGNKVTGLDASHNTALTYLNCAANHLYGLNVSGCTALEILACLNNNITWLDVSDCTALNALFCFDNPLSTYQIDQLFCSLPDRNATFDGIIYILNNASDDNYDNVIASNKQSAIAKNWAVKYYEDDTDIPATTGTNECPYPLIVGAYEITPSIAEDLTVLSTVSGTAATYNHSTKTLTLNNVTISGAYDGNGIFNEGIDNLKIKLIGNNSITTNFMHVIDLEKATEISGSGSLNITSNQGTGVYISNAPLTIKDCTIDIDAYNGIGGDSDQHLVIDNATVRAQGENYAIKGIADLTLNGCNITAPAGAAFDASLHGVALNGSLVTEQVVIEPIETYDLYIAGVQVDENNASDLSVIDGVSSTVSYDNDTKTLTLDNVTINTVDNIAIRNENIDDLKIKLIGNNNITTEQNLTLSLKANTEINGTGSLMATTNWNNGNASAIDISNSSVLTIKNCNVEAYSEKFGIAGWGSGESLVINNAVVKATGTEYASIGFINDLTLIDCSITTPEGAAFDEDLKGVALNGSIVTEQVVIEPFNSIEETKILGVSLYPNPAVDFVEISIDDANIKGLELQVYDVLGKLIIQQAITDQTTQLNIKNLEKGVYILKVGNNTQRFVKN